MDLTDTIIPKSDQLNAEDLLTGPRTFTVAEVRKGSSEQPVDIHLHEFPGRPFKPSKTVRRILVAAWGKDSAAYAGRRMTLYRDPRVRFGGQEVGGIRVSHLSHVEKRITLALTETRGKRATFVVDPLPDAPAPSATPAPDLRALGAAFEAAGVGRDARLTYCVQVVGREISAAGDLTAAEVSQVIDALRIDAAEEPTFDGMPA